MNHDIDKIRKNPKLEGQIGENSIWEGPLSKVGFPIIPKIGHAIWLDMARCC